MLDARRGVVPGPRFTADAFQAVPSARGEREEYRGGAVAPPQAGGRTERDGRHRSLPVPVPAADQDGGQAGAVPGAGLSLDGVPGVGEGFRLEGGFDPGPHGVQIDPDGRQRIAVKPAEQAGSGTEPDVTDDLLLDALRCHAVGAKDGAHGVVGGGNGQQ